MQREMHTTEDNPRNPNQPERRRDDRRQQEQQPNEERRHQQRRESMGGQMAQGGQAAQGGPNKGSQEGSQRGSQMGQQDAMTPDSLPRQGAAIRRKPKDETRTKKTTSVRATTAGWAIAASAMKALAERRTAPSAIWDARDRAINYCLFPVFVASFFSPLTDAGIPPLFFSLLAIPNAVRLT
jgi:hypothetical protein